jgi:hypothetical protein
MVKTLVEWPFPLLVLVFCCGSSAALFGLGYVFRRLPKHSVHLPNLERELFALVGAAFGIILAFIIFVQWSENDKMRSTINTETGAMAAMLRYTEDFDTTGEVKDAVYAYRDVIVKVAVPALKDGRVDDAWSEGGAGLSTLVRALQKIEPTNETQTFYDLAAANVDTLTTTHRDRIELSQSDLSVPMWSFVILYTLLMLALVALIQPADSPSAVLLLCSVAIFFGLTLSLIVTLNFPFNGTITASLEPYYRGILGQVG